jgi:hypothetical protein
MQHPQIRLGMSREKIAAHNGLTELHLKGHPRHAVKNLRGIIMSNCLPCASLGEVSAR